MNAAKEIPTTKTPALTKTLPLWKVILHNDDVNSAEKVVRMVVEFVHIPVLAATKKMVEAHKEGQSLLTITHFERAEMIQQQFTSCSPIISVSIEPV